MSMINRKEDDRWTLYAYNDINNKPVDDTVSKWRENDGDNQMAREFNGVSPEEDTSHIAVPIELSAGEWRL